MQIINLAALTLLATSALAADCSGNSGRDLYAWRNAWWDARQKMCSNSDCGYQKECTTYSSQKANKRTISVSLSRKYTGSKKGFKDCWVRYKNFFLRESTS